MEANPAEWSAARTYHFLTSAIAPRPIAWVTTIDAGGITNAAPFSWFQAVCADPPMLMLSIGDRHDGTPKDTLANLQATGEFVVNAAPQSMLKEMVASSGEFAPETSELDELGLKTEPSRLVQPPRIAGAPFHLECKLVETHRYGRKAGTTVVIGEVVHVACDDRFLDERGSFKPHEAHLLARLGGSDYLAVEDVFAYRRPKPDDAQRDQ